MFWVAVDVLLGVAALGALTGVVLGLWRRVKALGREVRTAGDAVGRATAALAEQQVGQRTPRRLSAPRAEVPDG